VARAATEHPLPAGYHAALDGPGAPGADRRNGALTESLRLWYESLGAEHAQGLFDSLDDPRVYNYSGDVRPPNAAVLAAQFAYMALGPPPHLDHERWLNYAVRLKAGGALIGRLEATITGWRGEIGYLIGPRFWGQRYAAEAVEALQNHLRRNERVTEIWATTAPGNAHSVRLLMRLGYLHVSRSWPPLASYKCGDLVFVLSQASPTEVPSSEWTTPVSRAGFFSTDNES
jgi:RimJ/RimL family protein N-acetyltransferase